MTTITTRSGKGSPLTNDEVDANFTNLNDDKVEASGDSITGNLSFGDNNKAIFGAGSDLQIYHDGSNSYIQDSGTGNLRIAGTLLQLNDASFNKYLQGSGDAVTLYNADSPKLATTSTGIDVTGNVVSDGLTVDGTAEISSASPQLTFMESDTTDLNTRLRSNAGKFQIHTANDAEDSFTLRFEVDNSTGNISIPNGDLDVTGTVTLDGATDGTAVALLRANNNSVTKKNTLRFEDTDTTTQNDQQIGRIEFYSNDTDHTGVDAVIEAVSATNGLKELRFLTSNTANTPLSRLAINKGGDISFYEDTGTTAKLLWSASNESLTLGGTNYSGILNVENTGTAKTALIAYTNDVGTTPVAQFKGYDNTNGAVNRFEVLANGDLQAYDTSNNVKLFWDASAESLGIGTSSPTGKIGIYGGGINDIPLVITHAWGSSSTALISASNSASEVFKIERSGKVGIGTSSPSNLVHLQSSLDTLLKIESTDTVVRLDLTDSGGTSLIQNTSGKLVLQADNANAVANSYLGFEVDGSEAMRIASSGNVGIGTDSPATLLHLSGADPEIRFSDTTNANYSSIVNVDGNMYYKADAGNQFGNSRHRFEIDGSEAMRIDSSGNVLVGTTSFTTTTAGIKLDADGDIAANRDGDAAAFFGRLTSDGEIVRFRKDGSTVGSIGVALSDNIYLAGNSSHVGIGFGSTSVYGANFGGGIDDGAVDLGASNARFKDLYLSGGAYLGGTGSANYLDDYEEGTFTPTLGGSTTNPTVTYAIQSGVYTKIGNLVTAIVVVGTSANTGGAGSIQIKGLPFNAKNASEYRARDMINTFNLDVDTNCIGVGAEGVQNANYLLLLESRDNAIWRQVDWTQATAASIYFAFTFQYYV